MSTTAAQRAARLGPAVVEITCGKCAIRFAVPQSFYDIRQVDSATFYCPLGHSQHYPAGKTEKQLANERAEWLERQLANRDEDLRSERASHSATKGQLTKAKKRAAAGVCPCCHRSFVQLSRHIATKHPEMLES